MGASACGPIFKAVSSIELPMKNRPNKVIYLDMYIPPIHRFLSLIYFILKIFTIIFKYDFTMQNKEL